MPIKLIAPPHTPFHANGDLNLDVVPHQAERFRESGVTGVFVGGSTGEGQSLTVDERLQLASRWVDVGKDAGLQVIIQVGHNCQRDAIRLASHAAEAGADAVATLAPCYFKPATVDDLINFCIPIAAAAESLPFFFYDIPVLTGVSLSTVDFLRRGADRMPNLAGVKYTNSDLIQFQECLRLDDGRFEILFGCDEALLAGYALGARGAVGSSYNFAAPLYHAMIQAADSGANETARKLQSDSVALIRTLQSYGYSAAAKTLMGLTGTDCGPVRSPLRNLSAEEVTDLRNRLAMLDTLPLRLIEK